LKEQLPTAEIHYLTKKSFASILQPNPYIHKLHLLDHSLKECVDRLKKEKFDYVIDLHFNMRTLWVKAGLGVKHFSFEKLNWEKWMMTRFKINRLPPIHIVDRYLETLSSFGVKNDQQGLDYFIRDDDEIKPEDLPKNHHSGYIGLVIGAALATKQLPVQKLNELCRKIQYPIILLGGPEDAKNGEQLLLNNPHVYNACGKYTLGQSASLVKQAVLIVTHDTGLMHIAAAFNKPILSIWGNTIPEFGMGPYYGEKVPDFIRHFEVKDLPCRPCSKIGYKKCPKGHFNCMQNQDLTGMVDEISVFLNDLKP
jgi:heptosyltransferase-2